MARGMTAGGPRPVGPGGSRPGRAGGRRFPVQPRPSRPLSQSLADALSGLGMLWRERNFRTVVAAGVVALGAAALRGLGLAGWLWVATAVAAVLASEGFNTAVEACVNLTAEAPHPLARRAKDIAAGVVLITIAYAVAVAAGVLILPVAAWSGVGAMVAGRPLAGLVGVVGLAWALWESLLGRRGG